MRFKPFSDEEDRIIRELRGTGATILDIARELRARGFSRDHNSVYRYIDKNGIEAPEGAVSANRLERLRAAAYRNAEAARAAVALTPEQAEDEFRRRWYRHIGNRAYPRYLLDHTDTPKQTGLSATSYMTTGGVAVYA